MSDDRMTLAGLVEAVDPNQARFLRDERTVLTRVPTPFLRRGLVFRFEWRGPSGPYAGVIGYAHANQAVYFLAGSPDHFDALTAAAGVALDTDEQRASLAVTRLEATRRLDETFVVLRSFDDMRLMNSPPPEVLARAKALRATYMPRIVPPRSEPSSGGWVVPVYVLSVTDLCLYTVSIGANGHSSHTRAVLEANTFMLPR